MKGFERVQDSRFGFGFWWFGDWRLEIGFEDFKNWFRRRFLSFEGILLEYLEKLRD